MAKAPDKPRRTLREDQRRFTRERLLDAGREVFGARGYAAATVDHIVAQARVSRGTFYLHFGSKAQLMGELVVAAEAATSAHYQSLDAVLASGSRERLREWLDAALGRLAGDTALIFAFHEFAREEPERLGLARPRLTTVADALTRTLARWPVERRDEARLRLELLALQLERFFERWAVTKTLEADRELAVRVLADLWHSALEPTAS